jgi:hypothetical protein
MAKKPKWLSPDEPLRHPDHPRPVSRREFIRQGFIGGSAMVTGGSLLNLLLQPQLARAATGVTTIDSDIAGWASSAGCPVNAQGAGKIPFICFDLAGGANLAGSNVMVGGPGGQSDFLSAAGYSKLGLPADRVPGLGFTDSTLGLMFHSQSALLAGILTTFTSASDNTVNGFVIPAVSDNDTNTNPHNPLYGIAKAGAKGSLLSLIGSVASVSGGNSMSPTVLIDPSLQPTKISQPSDDLALVDTGNLSAVLTNPVDVVHVMEAVTRISHAGITNSNIRGSLGGLNQSLQDSLLCSYAKSADTSNLFSSPTALDPTDATIQGIFAPAGGLNSNSEFRKTASVMKLVVNGYAGAGSITMGGYDYHTGDRKTGELRDLRAGYCIGACLQYAKAMGVPLMIYVFSDGSLFSNGTIDNQTISDGIVTLQSGKGVWTGDNSSTACAFSLVYDPRLQPTLTNGNNQIGYFQTTGSVATNSVTTTNKIKITAAKDVNSLVYTVLLNYMALHDQTNAVTNFVNTFSNQTLGTSGTALEDLIVLNQLSSVSGGKIVPL